VTSALWASTLIPILTCSADLPVPVHQQQAPSPMKLFFPYCDAILR